MKYLLIFFAALFLACCPASAQRRAAIQKKFTPRYLYKPVQTKKYALRFSVRSEMQAEGITQDFTTRIDSKLRMIPVARDSAGMMRLMLMLDDPVIITSMNGMNDTNRTTGWSLRRVELSLTPQGRIKEVSQVDKLPQNSIPGFTGSDESALLKLLTLLVPQLPDSLKGSTPFQSSARDSTITTYPAKVIQRITKERRSYKLIKRADSLLNCSLDTRIDATEFIFPREADAARVTETGVSKGEIAITESGILDHYAFKKTIYRDLQPIKQNNEQSFEETIVMQLDLQKE